MFDEEGNSDTHTETIDGASVGDEEPNGRETQILEWFRIKILPLGLRVWMRVIWCLSSTAEPM